MREFTKSLLSFSWALSLFGAKQTANLLTPGRGGQGGAPATDAFQEVTRTVVEQFGESIQQAFRVGDRLQREIVDLVFRGFLPSGQSGVGVWSNGNAALPLLATRSNAGEEVMLSYTRGQGRFSADKRFITLDMHIYTIDGQQNGRHQGVWERQFDDPKQLLDTPPPPTEPLNQPIGPVPKGPLAASTKAVWAFRDGSIFSVGPAASHLIPLSDGSFLFLVSTAQVITNGTGRFEGAYGLTQSLGATHVPKGLDLFGPGEVTFPATTLDTFKVRVVRTAPAPPVPQPSVNVGYRGGTGEWVGGATVEVHGSKMHYVERGSGDPILFVHGNPTWSYLWRNVIPYVSPYARCIAPDLIGMGLSDKPTIGYRFADHVRYLEGFIEKLGLRNTILVLHDWGCILGFYYAMRHEKKLKGLAFLEALMRPYASWSDFPAAIRPTFQAFRTPDVGYEKIVVENAFIDQVLPASMIRKLSAAEMDNYRRPFREPSSRKVIWRFANELPIAGQPEDVTKAVADYGRWLQATALPKLLIYATPGAITTEADVSWSQSNLKNLTATSVGRGIHFHQEDNPEGVGRAIANWYRSLAAPVGSSRGGRSDP